MFAPLPALTPGPSLPPKVNGEAIGTLTIRFQGCSVVDAFARIQFWGEQAFSDLHLYRNNHRPTSGEAVGSPAVEYPLVGSSFGLYKYLKDASPLQVRFLRHKKCSQLPNPKEENSLNDALIQPELIGCASIPDICISELLKPDTALDDTPKTTNLSLRRELQISTDSVVNDSSIVIGGAHFELLFRVISQPHNEYRKQGVIGHQSILLKQMNGTPIKQDQAQYSRIPTSYAHSSKAQLSCVSDYDSTQSIIDDSIGLHSDLCSNSDEEQQSLLEELLDLCTDDMTIPTIDSANTGVDPYDMWISRIVAHASSPPVKEFPSLVSAGSHQSNVLRKVSLIKLQIDELTLFSRVASRIKGKNDFYLQYNPPPQAWEPDRVNVAAKPRSSLIEFVVCEQFVIQTKMPSARRARSTTLKTKEISDILLLTSNHTKQMAVAFKDDNSIRQWLDSTMGFNLFYSASKAVSRQKLPRVAMLAGRRKEVKSVATPGRVCLGQACLRLRDVVLSDTLTCNAKLDLVLANNDELPKGVGEAGLKIGSLSVHLGLHPGDTMDQSSSCSTANSVAALVKTDEHAQILLKGLQSSSSLTPHPISVFLSSFAGSSNNVGAMASNEKCTPFYPVGDRQRSQILRENLPHSAAITINDEEQIPHCNMSRNKENMNAPLKPIKAPPVWLDIRVECISDLSIGAVNNELGSLQLGISCIEPILSVGQLTHSHSSSNNAAKFLSIGSEVRLREIMKLRTDGSNVFSSNTVCSLQVAIEAERKRDKNTALTLHIWHCSNDGDESPQEKTLVGLAKISFRLESSNGSQKNICNWLPGITANGWFDVFDTKSCNTPIGKVQVKVAAGMLRQIRGFPAVCKSVVIVERWWRKYRCNTKETREACERIHLKDPDHSVTTLDSPAGDCDPNSDAVHAGFDRTTLEQINDPASSPDSLFEEWSQQSLPMTRVQKNNTRQYEDTTTVAKHAYNQIQQNNQESAGSSRVSESDEELTVATDSNDSNKISTTEEESKTANDFECNGSCAEAVNVEAAASECQNVAHEQTRNASSNLNSCDQFEILVHLEKMSGIRDILLMWSRQQGHSGRETLLSVSGVFVSYSISHENTTTSQQEELHKLCFDDNVRHFQLVSAELIARDVELNLESTISMSNHETNTEMILAQMLEIKLWFVPVITTSIATMINSNKTKDIQILNGCAVISIAKCPLYHLYTSKGYYRGRVPWNVTVHGDKKDNKFIGCISMNICRANVQNSPFGSSLTSTEIQSDTNKNHVMSTLKPMNLEVSFSRGQDDYMRRITGIDPPEEIEQASSSKRKLKHSSAAVGRREIKRYRCLENPEMPCDTMAKSLNEVSHQNAASNVQDFGEELDTLCPSEATFECDQDSETEDTRTYHSLTSVMESLENINSKLQQASSFAGPQQKAGVCDDLRASSRAYVKSDVTDEDPKGHKHFHTSVKNDMTERLDCPGHQMEPPEENHVSETHVDGTAESNNSIADNVQTCEKGSSPIIMTRRYADATSSSCGDYLVDGGRLEDNEAKTNHFTHQKDVAEKHNTNKLEIDCNYKKDEGNPRDRNPSLVGLSGENLTLCLEQSNRKRERNSGSRVPHMQDYLTKSRGHLDGISKVYSSLVTNPSHSRGLRNTPCRIGQRNTSMLSPVLNLLSPTRNGILSRNADTWSGKRVFPNNTSSKEHSYKLGETSISIDKKDLHVSHNMGFMSGDKDRLEQIFLS